MLRIAIVEDEQEAYHQLKKYILKIEQEQQLQFLLTHYCTGEDFLDKGACTHDIVFMDIEMPGMSGMEAAKKMRQKNDWTQLLFTTRLAQFAIKGYEVDAADFLVKPISYYDFAMKMQKVLRRVQKKNHLTIPVATKTGLQIIPFSDLMYVEVSGHRLYYHTVRGVIDACGALKDLAEKLKGKGAARCNSCYLVNLNFVSGLYKDTVTVGSDTLKISRSRKKEFLDALTEWLEG